MSPNLIFFFFVIVSFLFCAFVSYDNKKLCWICILPPIILSVIHSWILFGGINGIIFLVIPLTMGINLVAALIGGAIGILIAKIKAKPSNNKQA